MYNTDKHGRTSYGSWWQATDAIVQSLTGSEGGETLPLEQQKFAQLVYTVNQPVISLSGQTLTTTMATYATVVQTSGAYTWVMKAAPGTATNDALWQAQEIVVSGSMTRIRWADGNTLFDNVADDYSVLNYI